MDDNNCRCSNYEQMRGVVVDYIHPDYIGLGTEYEGAEFDGYAQFG
jgi:hypothetical protein